MQRRMAKLSLAGVRFVMEVDGPYAWKVVVGDRVPWRFLYLERAINDTWREFLTAKSPKDADTEVFNEHFYDVGL